MKRKYLYTCLFTLLALTLASCKDASNSKSNSSSSSQIQANQISDWKATDKVLMEDYFGEVIPVAPLTESYVTYEEEDESGPYLAFEDKQSIDITNTYASILENHNYEYINSVEQALIYAKYFSETKALVIQIAYWEADALYDASMTILAWVEVEKEIDTSPLEDWSALTKTQMKQNINMILPLAPLTNMYESMVIENEEKGDYLYIFDEYTSDIHTQYGNILIENGFTYYGTESDSFGFYYFYKYAITDTSSIFVQLDYWPGHSELPEYPACFEIFAWVEGTFYNYEIISDWDNESKAIMNEYLHMVLPLAPLSENYVITTIQNNDSWMVRIYDLTVGNLCDDYGTILETNGFLSFGANEDNTAFYYITALTNDYFLFIQLDYFKGFEIIAWVTDYNSLFVTPISEWDTETTQSMNQILGETLPVAPLSTNYDFTTYQDDGQLFIFITDDKVKDVCTNYAAILEQAGYYLYHQENGTYVYALETSSTTTIMVQFDYNYLIYGFGILAWLDVHEDNSLQDWPENEINEKVGDLGISIPAFNKGDASTFDDYSYDSYISFSITITGLNESAIAEYSAILKKENWTVIPNGNDYFLAIDSSETYALSFYFDTDLNALVIYFDNYSEVPTLSWPSDAIHQLFNQQVDIPSYDGAAYFVNQKDNEIIILVAGCTEDDELDYGILLEDAGWNISDEDYDLVGWQATHSNYPNVIINFFNSNGYLSISIYLA